MELGLRLPSPFRLAKLARLHSNFTNYKMGAVIVKRKRPIALGFNSLKTHPLYSNGEIFFSVHAEMSAIIKSETNVEGSDIYIYRENKNGPALARPCKNCMRELKKKGIREIHYTISEYPFYESERL